MKYKRIAIPFFAVSLFFTGCSMPNTAGFGSVVRIADREVPGSSGETAIFAGESGVSVHDIKGKYGNKDTGITPFYNVSQNAAFLFRFNGKVEPASAVTVHTDSSCGMDSMVYQINEGYIKEDGGMDVAVKPGNPVMDMGKSKNYTWGNAPMYYLCIRYDMESEIPKKLDTPIIVPFTVKSPVSIPNAMPYINESGQFGVKWNPVDNAVKYNIYRVSKKYAKSAAECAYAGCKAEKVASVEKEQCTFHDFHKDGNTVSSGSNIIGQNFYDLDSYYVTAVDKDGKESAFSMAAESSLYAKSMPKTFENQSVFEKRDGVATVLPEMVGVKMCDGKTASFPVSYEKKGEEDGCAVYKYKIHGTLLTGDVKYKDKSGKYEDIINPQQQFSASMYDLKNEINSIPRNTVRTENRSAFVDVVDSGYKGKGKKIAYGKKECCARSEAEKAKTRNGTYPEGVSPIAALTGKDEIFGGQEQKLEEKPEKQKKNNKENKGDGYKFKIFADSAEEEYLALCIADAQENINIKPFASLSNTEYLTDVLYKVIYQNPYIIGVKSFSCNVSESVLHITYNKDKKTIQKQQEEIKKKAGEIIASCIKDGMNEEDKVQAIWDYLEENTEYDSEACNAAEKDGFASTCGYDDSFTAYGVLCKGKGVCQSYMYAMKLLCESAGVECKSLTGYLHNTIPHGWNAVKIDDDWCWVDATNTKKNSGVPYFIYQTSSEFAENSWNYVLDKNYELDDNLNFAVTDNMEHDWYVERGLYAENYSDIAGIVKNKAKEYNGNLYIKCAFAPDIYMEGFSDGITKALAEAGYTADEVNYSSLEAIGQVIYINLSDKAQ